MSSEEAMPFLDDEGRLKEKQKQWHSNYEPEHITRASWPITKVALFASILLNLVFFAGAVLLLAHRDYTDPHRFARSSIIYKDLWFEDKNINPMFAPPSNETDKAWDRVANPHVLRFRPDEVSHLGQYPIQLVDSTEYASSLSVYHEIHCLGWLRRFVYSDYYYPNGTSDDILEFHDHADHCINALLQSVMCSADTTPIVFHWHENDTLPYYPHPISSRTCVDWQSLEKTIKPRVIPEEELARLKSPFDS